MSGVPHPGPPPGDPNRHAEASRSADHVRSDQSRSDQGRSDQGRSDQGRSDQGRGGDGRDLWPRDFGRDGVSGLVTVDRAMRSRDVSRPTETDEAAAESVVADLLARIEGRPRSDNRSRQTRSAPQPVAHPPVPHPPTTRG
ncbi:hypothetical protein GCM10022236_07690 [Microlunatus ginsengisoli]|uniref:Uncharacterized protein n=1 Tax=Microlunatus ginsengisoli TaxID=363863 RepID=A0ABP6ZJV7_9ACTN